MINTSVPSSARTPVSERAKRRENTAFLGAVRGCRCAGYGAENNVPQAEIGEELYSRAEAGNTHVNNVIPMGNGGISDIPVSETPSADNILA